MLVLGRKHSNCSVIRSNYAKLSLTKSVLSAARVKHFPPLYPCKQNTAARWTVTLAQTGPSPSDDTIKSLESILGSSQDSLDEDGPEPPDRNLRRRRKVPDAAERRVRPLYVYVIYYCFIVVYLADAWLQATDGDLAASILVDGLVNDHLAVASGQVPRLATAGFVCDTPLELFLQLATLLTVGAEAEALLGYSLFWAVYWLANLSGGLADAAFSELPVTYGPANAAAGMVGALVAYYVRNTGLEERIAAARAAMRMRRRQILDGVGRDAAAASGSVNASRDSLEDAETEVEVLPLLSFKITSRVSPEAKGLLNVLVATVVAGQGLLDLGGASRSASWIGLIAAFWTGILLTYGAGPQYDVQYTLPRYLDGNGADGSGTPSGSDPSAPSGGRTSGSRSGHGAADEEPYRRLDLGMTRLGEPVPDDDGLKVVDVCPPSRRQGVLAGFVAALGTLILGWLAWMGTDI